MNRSGITLLEVVAATVLLAMASGAVLTAIRLGSRATSMPRDGYLRASCIPPKSIRQTGSPPAGMTIVACDTIQETDGQAVRWCAIQPDGQPEQACLRLIPAVEPEP